MTEAERDQLAERSRLRQYAFPFIDAAVSELDADRVQHLLDKAETARQAAKAAELDADRAASEHNRRLARICRTVANYGFPHRTGRPKPDYDKRHTFRHNGTVIWRGVEHRPIY